MSDSTGSLQIRDLPYYRILSRCVGGVADNSGTAFIRSIHIPEQTFIFLEGLKTAAWWVFY